MPHDHARATDHQQGHTHVFGSEERHGRSPGRADGRAGGFARSLSLALLARNARATQSDGAGRLAEWDAGMDQRVHVRIVP